MTIAESKWVEVWLKATPLPEEPPHVLVVRPDPRDPHTLLVYQPQEGYAVMREYETYGALRTWLAEQEYRRAEGRMFAEGEGGPDASEAHW